MAFHGLVLIPLPRDTHIYNTALEKEQATERRRKSKTRARTRHGHKHFLGLGEIDTTERFRLACLFPILGVLRDTAQYNIASILHILK
jgi:hypothetical protein